MERLEGYENIGHVIKVLEDFHRQLADALARTYEQTADERSKLIAGYLAGHQMRRVRALADFRRPSAVA